MLIIIQKIKLHNHLTQIIEKNIEKKNIETNFVINKT